MASRSWTIPYYSQRRTRCENSPLSLPKNNDEVKRKLIFKFRNQFRNKTRFLSLKASIKNKNMTSRSWIISYYFNILYLFIFKGELITRVLQTIDRIYRIEAKNVKFCLQYWLKNFVNEINPEKQRKLVKNGQHLKIKLIWSNMAVRFVINNPKKPTSR